MFTTHKDHYMYPIINRPSISQQWYSIYNLQTLLWPAEGSRKQKGRALYDIHQITKARHLAAIAGITNLLLSHLCQILNSFEAQVPNLYMSYSALIGHHNCSSSNGH